MQLNRIGLFRAAVAVVGLVAFSAQASAQCASPSAGPDVIVGDLNGTQNYTASGSLEAVAIGTTSCNIGNVDLNWIQDSVNHPLIGGGVYKYKVVNGAGRFEQLGLSWVKHAFAAFQENICCVCSQPGGLLSVLHPGCSDPYTPARNGQQSLLGPRFQVNPNTGTYTVAHPTPTGVNGGRIQINVADLETNSASVLYYGEMQYVALDDSKNNNNDNNTSYRPMSVSGSGSAWTFGVLASTVRSKCAVEAWQTIDASVTLKNVITPESSSGVYDGTGRLVLGYKVTSLGAGQWHYEYALYNQNSDRAVQAFSLPIPAGVTVTNIGFHDVDYLGGDGVGGVNQTATDWTGTVNAGAITWASQTLAQNSNANALRFGTTYNFRFDADQPPTPGNLTLTQFKVVNNVIVPNVDVPQAGSPPTFLNMCLGDGTSTACPCGNSGSPGNGCANSVFASGGSLSGSGTASVSADTVVLTSNNLSGSTCVFFQGDAEMPPVVVDDGLGCVTGSVIRLGTKPIGLAASQYPDVGDPSVSVRGSVPGAGGTRFYQCFYRNAAAAFCPPATSNRTNGTRVIWTP